VPEVVFPKRPYHVHAQPDKDENIDDGHQEPGGMGGALAYQLAHDDEVEAGHQGFPAFLPGFGKEFHHADAEQEVGDDQKYEYCHFKNDKMMV
jgi:hypothetical protein